MEAARVFLLDTVRESMPAPWPEVRRAAEARGFRKTKIYEARKTSLDEGSLVLEDDHLWIPSSGTEEAWRFWARFQRDWLILSSGRIARARRAVCAHSLGIAASRFESLLCSARALRTIARELPRLDRPVVIALLPLLQRLLRFSFRDLADTVAQPAPGRWTAESARKLAATTQSALRRVIRDSSMTVEEINLCANLVFELLRQGYVNAAASRFVAEWAIEQLRAARSESDYLDRWEALRAMFRETFRLPQVRRRVVIRALHDTHIPVSKPWLADLADRLNRPEISAQ